MVDSAAVRYVDGAWAAALAGYVNGGTRRNPDWVAPHVDLAKIDEQEALLLADAQTSGGLLIAGELVRPSSASWCLVARTVVVR